MVGDLTSAVLTDAPLRPTLKRRFSERLNQNPAPAPMPAPPATPDLAAALSASPSSRSIMPAAQPATPAKRELVRDPRRIAALDLMADDVTRIELRPEHLTANGELLIDLALDCSTSARHETVKTLGGQLTRLAEHLKVGVDEKIPGGLRIAWRITRFDGHGVHRPDLVSADRLNDYLKNLNCATGYTHWSPLLEQLARTRSKQEPISAGIILRCFDVDDDEGHTDRWNNIRMSFGPLKETLPVSASRQTPIYGVKNGYGYTTEISDSIHGSARSHPQNFGAFMDATDVRDIRRMLHEILRHAARSAEISVTPSKTRHR